MRSACRPTICASAAWPASCCGWTAGRASSKRSAPSRATQTAAKPRPSPRACRHRNRRKPAQSGRRDERHGHHPLDDQQGRQPSAGQLPAAHGYLPMGGVKYPTLGSHVAHQIGDPTFDLPSFVRIGGRGATWATADSWASTTIRSCCKTPSGGRKTLSRPRATSATHAGWSCSKRSKPTFGAVEGADIVADHRKLIRKSSEMILSPQMKAFDLAKEPDKMRDAYGRTRVGCRLSAGAAAGRSRRHVRRGECRRLGHARRQLQPRRRSTTAQSTSRWPSSSPTCASAACSRGRW